MGKGVTGDYIRTYLGLMGSGKTTQAIRDVEARDRAIIYTPGPTNPGMHAFPHIFDTPEYLRDLQRFLALYPKLRVDKKSFPSAMFHALAHVKGYTILLDDLATLKTNSFEARAFDAFIRTVRINGNNVIITTHRATSDLSPLVRNISTSAFYVGPGTMAPDEIRTLYGMCNYQIGSDEFSDGLKNNSPIEKKNGRISKMPGLFPIRRLT